jgi:hypothetical protein
MEGRRRDGVEKGTQQCPSMSKVRKPAEAAGKRLTN